MSSIPYIVKVLLYIILLNIVFSIVTISWATEEDMGGLPEQGVERFVSLFFSGITIFSSIGFGDITPKSKRMRLYMSVYMVFSLLLMKYYL
jgi:hypothetical protein